MPMSTAQHYAKLKQQIADGREQMEIITKNIFTGAVQELFDRHPELLSFGWSQYTPYPDGGGERPFRFRRNSDFPSVTILAKDGVTRANYNDDIEETVDDEGTVVAEEDYDIDLLNSLAEKVGDMLEIFDEKDMTDMFGDDDIKFTVTREGIIDDDFEHD